MNVKVKIAGAHSGEPYAPGDVISVSDKEGEMLLARGLAEPVEDIYSYAPIEEEKPQTRRGRQPKGGETNAGPFGG